ncbi:MAG: 2,3-bisphosphoglycerate-independent phosphoglycerate mutase [Candidatus Harrisonbacteria bacterium CG10_big_fil_rev_8_21_14_0_10_42_17]|uniref:2,3-bisphosphoglycerate-independent phosphoglycerate mutase n=1 Tax=Candidatus Harrisonbacteria bacterium CG10_big_fil_rev_8_21_14_0_10_42_17 TaxID=1974584 RepID=A0A2M6WJA9_9BACT|nr:MAG: 2,3-bisphosphoglycerate-independent phosphoglycerate mutase [Candidatus Harrisonbacteria bacterium CG10_big_fil_rev_8_21_14_0_10_42_17]
MKNVTLLILDGWGIGSRDYSNAIHTAEPAMINYIRSNYAIGSLQSAGIAVGLPWEEEGNSEVGHLTIGAGKVIYQHFPRITMSIEDGSFFENTQLMGAFNHAKEFNAAVHFAGLLTMGNVHASLQHIGALIDMASRQGCKEVYLHLFSDGKDSPPQSTYELIQKVQKYIDTFGVGKVASIGGRHYALDRDSHWNRTQKEAEVMIGKGLIKNDIKAAIEENYQKGLDDNQLEPFLVGPNIHPIRENDALIFFDYREDSIRQIARAFIAKNFNVFPFERPENLYITTFTQYEENLDTQVAFPREEVENPLTKVLADNNKTQIHIAETEKYAHVTYFFDGYREQAFENEYQVLIPSQKALNYDEHPEMMTREIASRIIESIASKGFDLIVANFANSDMVAHTGNYEAATQAVRVIDEEIRKIYDTALSHDSILIITSDHGNIEKMIDPLTGKVQTSHAANPVPFYLIGSDYVRPKTVQEANMIEKNPIGLLSDIAPTILHLLEIEKPEEMSGQNLIPLLQ